MILFTERDPDDVIGPGGRPSKPLHELKLNSANTRARTNRLFKCAVEEAAKNQTTPEQICFYIIHRSAYHSGDRKLAEMCLMFFRNLKAAPKPFSIPEGSFTKAKFGLSKKGVIDFRRLLKSKNVDFPAYHRIHEFEKSISPRELHFPSKDDQYYGIKVNLEEAVTLTVSRIIEGEFHDQGDNVKKEYY
jgi:hypothetical protein